MTLERIGHLRQNCADAGGEAVSLENLPPEARTSVIPWRSVGEEWALKGVSAVNALGGHTEPQNQLWGDVGQSLGWLELQCSTSGVDRQAASRAPSCTKVATAMNTLGMAPKAS